jgi:hypothetical protein
LSSTTYQSILLDIQPVKGKTYSLFGNFATTHFFYERVSGLVDQILEEEQLPQIQLLDYIQHVSRNRRVLRRHFTRGGNPDRLSRILDLLHSSLQEFTTDIEAHIKSAPSYKILTDRTLLTSREQYYLYMIEFELVNRIHLQDFKSANFRLALLPYCIRETQTDCKAVPDHIDYQCRRCAKGCYINHVSQILKRHQVEPYIWRRTKLKPMLKGLVREHGSVGVAGIACIAELVAGMRRCMDAHLPVVGIPLNANRCPRWMGSFHENSVDLDALDRLLGQE